MKQSAAKPRTGVLLTQLGTPDAPSASAIRKYLKEMLSDFGPKGAGRIAWLALLHLYILPLRPKRLEKMYGGIWSDKGSPLLSITNGQRDALRRIFAGAGIEVECGMRYGSPSIRSSVESLYRDGCRRLLLFPLFPQYSAAVSASAYNAVFAAMQPLPQIPALRVVESFYAHPAYTGALAVSINEELRRLVPKPEYLILSYHGLPVKEIERGDPYAEMCLATTSELEKSLEIDSSRVLHTYQSRFGRAEWLKPDTHQKLRELAARGVKRVAVACPGFLADCLETLHEIGIQARDDFLSAGGESFTYIRCLNTGDVWVGGMKAIIEENLQGWI